MNPLGALIMVVLIGVVLSASRRIALLGMLASVMYLTQAQQIELFGLNLYAVRFLELAGFIRVMARREISFRELNGVDRALIWLYTFNTAVSLLCSTEAVGVEVGAAVDAFLCYFTFRGLIRNREDFQSFLRSMIFLLVPYTGLVFIECLTRHNPLGVLGGITGGEHWMRHGLPRCFGSFRQPDTLGMFAASFVPLYIGLARKVTERKPAVLGICLCLALIFAANSGGAVAGTGVGAICWFVWRFRTRMRKVRWVILAVLCLLALVMKAPIWYIFAHISSVTGGDGWHRSYLMDVAYQHFGQWWLSGIPLSKTSGWFPYDLSATGGADITNQFIAFGLTAGLGGIILFILLLKRAYGTLGRAMAAVRSIPTGSNETEFMLWGLGVMLTIHIVNWFGIAYFDQMNVVWLMQLAAVSSLSDDCLKEGHEATHEENQAEPGVTGGLDPVQTGY